MRLPHDQEKAGMTMLYAVGLFFAFWLGTLMGSVITARLVKNSFTNRTELPSKPQVKENMFPYDWEMDEKFLTIIDNYKRGK